MGATVREGDGAGDLNWQAGRRAGRPATGRKNEKNGPGWEIKSPRL